MAGVLLAAAPVGAACMPGALTPPFSEPGASREEEEEEALLALWGLDPEDFPKEREEYLPEIPEDLLSYFQDSAAAAADHYNGSVPPAADLRKYSPRADAIRKAIREKEAERLAKAYDLLDEVTRLFPKAQKELAPGQLLLLQGKDRQGMILPEHSQSAASLQEDTLPGDDPTKNARHSEKTYSWNIQQMLSLTHSSGRGMAENGDSGGLRRFAIPKNEPAAGDGSASSRTGNASGHIFLLRSDPQGKSKRCTGVIREPAQDSVQPVVENTSPDKYLFPGLARFPDDDHMLHSPADAAVPDLLYKEKAVDSPLAGRFSEDTPHRVLLPLADAEKGSTVQQRRIVYIGDSRTVGMQIYVGGQENEFWQAKNSMGYSWFAKSAVPGVEDLIGENTDVVILMGVNDLGNVGRYVDFMNEKAAEWKKRGARTFFVSVTPVIDAKSPNAKNARIEAFNAYAVQNLRGVYYIDAYSRIRSTFGSPDGIHFDSATYREIYRIIRFYLYTGWYEEAGLRFYFDRGKPLTGWQYLDGRWQYFDGYGVRWADWGRIGGVCLDTYPYWGILDPYEAVLTWSLE